MKRALLLLALFCLGYAAKIGVVEAERLLAVGYVDACIAGQKRLAREDREKCFEMARSRPTYRFIEVLNAQPNFWMR